MMILLSFAGTVSAPGKVKGKHMSYDITQVFSAVLSIDWKAKKEVTFMHVYGRFFVAF